MLDQTENKAVDFSLPEDESKEMAADLIGIYKSLSREELETCSKLVKEWWEAGELIHSIAEKTLTKGRKKSVGH